MLEIERRVLDSIDTDGMLGYLRELIAVPSVGGEETAAQEHVAAKLASLGFVVDKWEIELEAVKRHPSFSMAIERDEGLGVVGTLDGGKNGRSLILNGHIDVVSPGDEGNWSYPPWEGTIADDLVYGRGAADMKGGLCCAVFAAKAIIDSGIRLRGRLMIESVIGEEDGGVGALATVLRGYRADGAVIMEPTELKVGPAHSGALSFRVTVPGRSAHACVREEGVSAIEKFIPIHNALIALEKMRNEGVDDPLYSRYKTPFPINIGKVQGGNWPGSVAESLVFEGRIGVIVGEGVEEARSSIENAVAKISSEDPWFRDNPPSVEWWGYQFEPASISIDDPIVKTLSGAFADASDTLPEVEGMTYASYMRHLINVGNTPTALFGPGDVRKTHSPDEHVPIDELVKATRTLALTAMRFCGCEKL